MPAGTPTPLTARQRARAEITAEILAAARRQLAEVGASALSLRSVARDVGMVSSAVYRYFPSRDDLLTALIVEAYDAVGAAAEAADAEARRTNPLGRWLRVCQAVRSWAVAHPHQYSLIYGSPVPQYRAPADTIVPATRVQRVLLTVLADGVSTGQVTGPPPMRIPRSVRRDLEVVRAGIGIDLDDDVMAAGMLVWTSLLGAISVELFGHLANVVHDHDEYFEHQMRRAFAPLMGEA